MNLADVYCMAVIKAFIKIWTYLHGFLLPKTIFTLQGTMIPFWTDVISWLLKIKKFYWPLAPSFKHCIVKSRKEKLGKNYYNAPLNLSIFNNVTTSVTECWFCYFRGLLGFFLFRRKGGVLWRDTILDVS